MAVSCRQRRGWPPASTHTRSANSIAWRTPSGPVWLASSMFTQPSNPLATTSVSKRPTGATPSADHRRFEMPCTADIAQVHRTEPIQNAFEQVRGVVVPHERIGRVEQDQLSFI